jgi:flavin-binding protein dodecin
MTGSIVELSPLGAGFDLDFCPVVTGLLCVHTGEKIMGEAAAYRGESKKAKKEAITGVSKVIELQAESAKGWEDAVQLCVAEAVRTVRNITSVSVDEFKATVSDDAIQLFHVRCRVSFTIDDAMRAH